MVHDELFLMTKFSYYIDRSLHKIVSAVDLLMVERGLERQRALHLVHVSHISKKEYLSSANKYIKTSTFMTHILISQAVLHNLQTCLAPTVEN